MHLRTLTKLTTRLYRFWMHWPMQTAIAFTAANTQRASCGSATDDAVTWCRDSLSVLIHGCAVQKHWTDRSVHVVWGGDSCRLDKYYIRWAPYSDGGRSMGKMLPIAKCRNTACCSDSMRPYPNYFRQLLVRRHRYIVACCRIIIRALVLDYVVGQSRLKPL